MFLSNFVNRINYKIIPPLVFVVCSAITIFTYSFNKSLDQEKVSSIFENQSNQNVEKIQDWVNVNIEILESVKAFYNSSKFVDREEFRVFTKDVISRYKSIQALEWVPKVLRDERKEYEDLAVVDGLESFKILEKVNGQLIKSRLKDEYYPVYYAEPFLNNQKALGYDLFSNKERRLSLVASRDSGKVVATEVLDLVQKNQKKNGILIFDPVYKKKISVNSVNSRQENLVGFVLGVYLVDDILESLLSEKNFNDSQIYIYEKKNKSNLKIIYPNNIQEYNFQEIINRMGSSPKKLKQEIFFKASVSFAGQEWNVLMFPKEGFYKEHGSKFLNVLLVLGMLLSCLISWIMFLILKQKKVIEEKVVERTNELKEAQEKLSQSKKLASIGQLAAGVAHEINNPLAFVSSNIDFLKECFEKLISVTDKISLLKENSTDGKIDVNEIYREGEKEDLKMVLGETDNVIAESNDGVERIKLIVNQLRVFSREKSDDFVKVKLEDLIENTLKILRSDLLAKVTLEKDFQLLSEISCDPRSIEQVFINIITNAIQSFDSQGHISIKTYPLKDFGCVEIKDEGNGISEEELEKIFDPFFTTKAVGQGTGLGLSISYDIVKKHGGEIKVSSKKGKGTVFKIMLPAERRL